MAAAKHGVGTVEWSGPVCLLVADHEGASRHALGIVHCRPLEYGVVRQA
jgi:hypothetical protein